MSKQALHLAELIKLLPLEEQLLLIELLKKQAGTGGELETETGSSANNSVENLILKGPVMTDEHYSEFLTMRQSFNTWRRV